MHEDVYKHSGSWHTEKLNIDEDSGETSNRKKKQ